MPPHAGMMMRIIALLTVWLVVSGFGFSSKAPQAWEDWAQSNPQDIRVIDHGEWTALLKKYVKPGRAGLNTFAYGKVTAGDKAALQDYIGSLEAIEVTGYNKNEQLAYWINLYNAVTIRVVLDHYPVKTIRDIDISGFLKNGPWQKELVTVEDTPLTLDDIEHAILRPIWKDPRIHYGVNCASVGCPNLQVSRPPPRNLTPVLTHTSTQPGVSKSTSAARCRFLRSTPGLLMISAIRKPV